LADGTSSDQDFQPSGFGKSRGFSVDEIDMTVAASCFGGQGSEDEDPWASMTLWAAMKNGDVYALCPLLPSRWCPSFTTIPSLSTSAISHMAAINDKDTNLDERRAAEQYEWSQQLDEQDSINEGDIEVRYRPEFPSAIPRLQGPYNFDLDEQDIEVEITDLVVFPAQLDGDEIYSAEEEYEAVSSGLPFTALMMATSESQIHIALETQGITGQWLPNKGRSTFTLPVSEGRDLALVDTVHLKKPSESNPGVLLFSPDPVHQYSTFVTDGYEISSISLEQWATRVVDDLTTDVEFDTGLRTRLETSCKNKIAVVESLITAKQDGMLSNPLALDDVELGYLLLNFSVSRVYGASLDHAPFQTSTLALPAGDIGKSQDLGLQLVQLEGERWNGELVPTRPVYMPPRILGMPAEQPISQLLQKLPMKPKRTLKDNPMRLSPVMLEIMTATHRTISRQTTELEAAAAELFRRCERLREELVNQVKQMADLAEKLHRIRHGNEDDYDKDKKEHKTPDQRIEAAKERQATLMKRYTTLREKVGKVGRTKQELSAKEASWMAEIEALKNNVGTPSEHNNATSGEGTMMERYEAVSPPSLPQFNYEYSNTRSQVKELAKKLLDESNRLQNQHDDLSQSTGSGSGNGKPSLERSDSSASRRSGTTVGSRVPGRFQREKIAEVMANVEREGAIIEAVLGRLEKLQV
jgi:nucleoporin NUP82